MSSDNLQLAQDSLARFLHDNPQHMRDKAYISDWLRGFLDVCEAIDNGEDATRVASGRPSEGFNDGKRCALLAFDVD